MGVFVMPEKDLEGNLVQRQQPFASKATPEGVLYKRVEGVMSGDIQPGATENIDLVVSVPKVKFTGAEMFNVEFGDAVDFTVHDTAENTFSQLDVVTYGANFELNKFGYQVVMPPGGKYHNTSQYDASLYQGMIVRCRYTNNGAVAKKVSMNVQFHEVRDS